VRDVDERIEAPMFSLGREVATPSGPIDNLLISRSGQIVVVETKLWRNPEMRREVVAQILDYAAHVRGWHYEDLARLWKARFPDGGPLWRAASPDEDEASWIDRVEDNLAAGRMTLLVVGDGIEGRAEALAELVGGRPDFAFRLALVELRLFNLPDGQVLVVPSTLARTSEIERATVRITYAGAGPRPEVQVEVPRAPIASPAGSRARGTFSAQTLISELERLPSNGRAAATVADEILRQIESHPELEVDWKSAGFAVKAADPMSAGDVLSLAVVQKGGLLYVYWPWIEGQITKRWQDAVLARQIANDLVETIKPFGGGMDPTGLQLSVPLPGLQGREADLIGALTAFVARVGVAAAKLRS
jgi:hypothetical protein